jgi:ElaB/YqjD/DUF883 family membrane-anchored ribosome-binding protein
MATPTPNETMTSEMDGIKEDIQRLRDDLGALFGDVGFYSKERLADTRDRLSAAIEAIEGRAYGRLQGTSRMMRDRSQRAMDASRQKVEQRPMTYVAAAFAAGVIIASLFEWKKTS